MLIKPQFIILFDLIYSISPNYNSILGGFFFSEIGSRARIPDTRGVGFCFFNFSLTYTVILCKMIDWKVLFSHINIAVKKVFKFIFVYIYKDDKKVLNFVNDLI